MDLTCIKYFLKQTPGINDMNFARICVKKYETKHEIEIAFSLFFIGNTHIGHIAEAGKNLTLVMLLFHRNEGDEYTVN